jgi:hypothetical protein
MPAEARIGPYIVFYETALDVPPAVYNENGALWFDGHVENARTALYIYEDTQWHSLGRGFCLLMT